MRKRLEKVFLLNVLLEIDSLESVKKFIEINSKCQEVSTMLRLYTKRREKDSDNPMDHRKKIIPKNLFTLFPKIETIECDLQDMIDYPEIMEEVTFIRLKEKNYYNYTKDSLNISKEIKNKVVSVDYNRIVNISSIVPVDHFINCKYLSIYSRNINNETVNQIKNLILKKLIVHHEGYQRGIGDWNLIENISNVEEKNLLVSLAPNQQIIEMYEAFKEEMKDIFNNVLLSFEIIENFVPDMYFEKNAREIDLCTFGIQFYEDHRKMELKSIDLREYKQLERIVFPMNITYKISIEGLENLKEVSYAPNVFDVGNIPSTVSKIIFADLYEDPYDFTRFYDINNQGIEFDIEEHQQIKSVEVLWQNNGTHKRNIQIERYLPNKYIVLDELILTEVESATRVNSNFCHSSNALEILKSAQEYENICKKKLIMKCQNSQYYTQEEINNFLENVHDPTIEVETQIIAQWGNINDIPENETHLLVKNNFDCQFITNPKVFEQIESLQWDINHRGTSDLLWGDFSLFTNCKKMKMNIVFSGSFMNYVLPPNIEELELSSSYNSPETVLSFQELTKLKKFKLKEQIFAGRKLKIIFPNGFEEKDKDELMN